jgi:putative transposase
MKRSKYTEERIIGILKERQGGMKVADLTRKYGVSEQSIYRWQAKYGGMTFCEAKRSRQLEEENTRLKRMVSEFSLDR